MPSQFVIDANVLMAMLISGKSFYRTLMKQYEFMAPVYILEEIQTYYPVIRKQSRLDEEAFWSFATFAFSHLTILPSFWVQPHQQAQATNLTQSVDPKDEAYIALALQLRIPLLTWDRVLHHGLRKQGFRQTLLFDTFLRLV